MTTNGLNMVEMARRAIEAAAAKIGCDVSGLRMEPCVLDRTWGDKCGLLFSGPCAERAAAFFARWIPTHFRSTYQAQASFGQPQAHGLGFAVSYVYYPCAE